MTTKKPEVTEAAAPVAAPKADITLEMISQVARALANEMGPALAAAQSASAPAVVAAPPSKDTNPAICHICRQHLKTGCGGRHVNIVCYPDRYPEFGKFYPGSIINGVAYLSNGPTDTVPVPADAAPHIIAEIRKFEFQERQITQGQVLNHNSGHINQPNAVQPGTIGWR